MPPHDAEEEGLLLLGRVSGGLGVAEEEQRETAGVWGMRSGFKNESGWVARVAHSSPILA